MKIAILTIGTRGDVQPYAVLGQALRKRGHEVTLSTAKNFEQLVKSYDIDFLPVEADFQDLLNSDEGKKMMKGNPFAVRRNLHTIIYPLITNSLSEFYKLARECDVVLYHVKTMADAFADQFPNKMVRTSVIPIVEATREFANPSFSGLPLPKFINRFTYSFTNLGLWLLSNPIRKFRSQFDLPLKFKVPMVGNLYGISPALLPAPKDLSADSRFTGFWYGVSKDELSEDVWNFIKAGEPPLLLTFGSMPFKTKFDLQALILKLVDRFNTRMIVVRGWGLTETEMLEQDPRVKVISSAPYEKLFPLVKAIVHHGGVGTTAECLRAGKPFLVCPILHPIGDQKFWGQLGYNKGVAVRPIPISRMTEEKFLDSIRLLLSDKALYENALRVKMVIEKEDGLQNTVDEIEQRYANIKLIIR